MGDLQMSAVMPPTSAVTLGIGMPQPGVNISSHPGRVVLPPGSQQQLEDAAHSNLWVGGLPEGTDEVMFRSLFARYGSIASAKLVAEKRYGFVKFTSKHEAQAAIDALNGFENNG